MKTMRWAVTGTILVVMGCGSAEPPRPSPLAPCPVIRLSPVVRAFGRPAPSSAFNNIQCSSYPARFPCSRFSRLGFTNRDLPAQAASRSVSSPTVTPITNDL